MNLRNTAWQLIKWKFMQRRLGYSDEEMKMFRANPRNERIMAKIPEFLGKRIVAEVIESRGCNSRHQVGDRFVFDGAGNLLTEECPKNVCIFALHAMTPQVFAAGELIVAGADPNGMRFNRVACFDVGVECGGWGHVVMEVRVEDAKGAPADAAAAEPRG